MERMETARRQSTKHSCPGPSPYFETKMRSWGVLLNRAPIELAYHVIADGERIYETDRAVRVEHEAYVLERYGDFRAHREQVLSDRSQWPRAGGPSGASTNTRSTFEPRRQRLGPDKPRLIESRPPRLHASTPPNHTEDRDYDELPVVTRPPSRSPASTL